MFGWRKNERGEGGGERWEGFEGLRVSPAALYLAFYLGMWRAKMKKNDVPTALYFTLHISKLLQ